MKLTIFFLRQTYWNGWTDGCCCGPVAGVRLSAVTPKNMINKVSLVINLVSFESPFQPQAIFYLEWSFFFLGYGFGGWWKVGSRWRSDVFSEPLALNLVPHQHLISQCLHFFIRFFLFFQYNFPPSLPVVCCLFDFIALSWLHLK